MDKGVGGRVSAEMSSFVVRWKLKKNAVFSLLLFFFASKQGWQYTKNRNIKEILSGFSVK